MKVEFQRELREMIIKQQNETLKYEARLEKLNKTIKNKKELLQKKRIERISANLEAKSAGRGKNQQSRASKSAH